MVQSPKKASGAVPSVMVQGHIFALLSRLHMARGHAFFSSGFLGSKGPDLEMDMASGPSAPQEAAGLGCGAFARPPRSPRPRKRSRPVDFHLLKNIIYLTS